MAVERGNRRFVLTRSISCQDPTPSLRAPMVMFILMVGVFSLVEGTKSCTYDHSHDSVPVTVSVLDLSKTELLLVMEGTACHKF